MANNQEQFDEFLENIQLIGKDLDDLRTSRDANRDRIKTHWKDVLKRKQPDFEEQGSFEMGTVVRPLEGDYDLDDGMYLQCMSTDPAEWESTDTVQGWVVDAVEGYTRSDPEKRKRCVRVPYKGGYHIDIPAYGKDSFGTVRVYEKGKKTTELVESNPTALVDWFNDCKKSHSDLRDLVRFFKAWHDYKKGKLMKLKSVAMTILISERIVSNDRFDQAVVDTARKCEEHLRGGGRIMKPVSPYEDLTESWTVDDRTAIADAFKALTDRGQDAINSSTVRSGAQIWQKQFGNRYPVPEEEAENSKSGALKTTKEPVVASGSFA